MKKGYVDSKDDKEENINVDEEIDETTTTTEEEVESTEETEESTEEAEESTEDEASEDEANEETDDEEDFDYDYYGKETVEETKNMAEKMFNDVVNTLKTRQSEWNKTLEEYKANKPAVDLLEYENDLVLKLDAPRASKEDISIKLSIESIEILIDFPDYLEDDDVKVLRKERCSGKTKNVIPLPLEVDIKEVKATFVDNELTITLPKIKGRKVDVEIV